MRKDILEKEKIVKDRNLKILFIRPPRYFWPMNSESSSFWQPLGFASMAAVLRDNGFKDVKILDCLPLQIGWKSLKKILDKRPADVICVGDETASYCEAVKVVNYVKSIHQDVICVAGGYHFGNMIKESFQEFPLDFIVKGEGELTLLELMQNISKEKKDFSKVKGLAFRKGKEIIINKERDLIKNLDELPYPAYDLLPMHLYGSKSKNHKDFIALEHGRGCTGGCSFCSIWSQMAKISKDSKGKNIKLPCYRTKSAKRCFEETKYFVEKYDRKTINWVDGTFNLDPNWSKEYFNLLKKNKLKVQHTAWMRADCIVRDEKLGILKEMVEMGLVQAVIGMERLDNKSLARLNKKNNSYEINKKAFSILRERHSSVYTIATLIYGMPDDKLKDLFQINKIIHSNFADMIFMLPFTPYPGTKEWKNYKNNFKKKEFKKFNLHTPITGTKFISKRILDIWFKVSLIDYVLLRPRNLIRRVSKERDSRKKNLQKSIAYKIFRLGTQFLVNKLTFKKGYALEFGVKPDWYDK